MSKVNIGCGTDVSIKELAELIVEVVGYEGNLEYDTTRPDGAPRKQLDVSLISSLGWKPYYDLKTGVQKTIKEVTNSISFGAEQ
jgi:GDP-L-fucose synthase